MIAACFIIYSAVACIAMGVLLKAVSEDRWQREPYVGVVMAIFWPALLLIVLGRWMSERNGQ